MKVGELIKELQTFNKNCNVLLVKDWVETNERGELTNLADLNIVTRQTAVVYDGIKFQEVEQVLLDFD